MGLAYLACASSTGRLDRSLLQKGILEKNMETRIVCWGYLGLYWDNILTGV